MMAIRMRPKFPDACLTVEGKPRKNLNQEIDLTGDGIWTSCVRSNDVTTDIQVGYVGGSPGDVGEVPVTMM